MLYAALGGLLLLVATGGYAWVQTSRLETAQAKLEVCATQYDLALKSIAKQNKGVKDLQEASKTAQDRSRRALDKAAGGRVAAESEAARLKGELGRKPVTACAAGEAVVKVREGLR